MTDLPLGWSDEILGFTLAEDPPFDAMVGPIAGAGWTFGVFPQGEFPPGGRPLLAARDNLASKKRAQLDAEEMMRYLRQFIVPVGVTD